jgi:hypothetical protein
MLIVFLVGCGKGPVYQDDTFRPYVDMFKNYYQVDTSYLTIKFNKLKNNNVGICYFSQIKVEIDSEFWSLATEDEKEQLIFHELGHCVLGLSHNTNLITYDKDNTVFIPESIMYPKIFAKFGYYKEYRNYYFEQLKNYANN